MGRGNNVATSYDDRGEGITSTQKVGSFFCCNLIWEGPKLPTKLLPPPLLPRQGGPGGSPKPKNHFLNYLFGTDRNFHFVGGNWYFHFHSFFLKNGSPQGDRLFSLCSSLAFLLCLTNIQVEMVFVTNAIIGSFLSFSDGVWLLAAISSAKWGQIVPVPHMSALFFIDRQSARELRITRIPRDAVIQGRSVVGPSEQSVEFFPRRGGVFKSQMYVSFQAIHLLIHRDQPMVFFLAQSQKYIHTYQIIVGVISLSS